MSRDQFNMLLVAIQDKTDDASDDEAEFVNNQIDFRIGEGADAKDGGVLKLGESAVLTFKVKVKESIKSNTTVKMSLL